MDLITIFEFWFLILDDHMGVLSLEAFLGKRACAFWLHHTSMGLERLSKGSYYQF